MLRQIQASKHSALHGETQSSGVIPAWEGSREPNSPRPTKISGQGAVLLLGRSGATQIHSVLVAEFHSPASSGAQDPTLVQLRNAGQPQQAVETLLELQGKLYWNPGKILPPRETRL